MRVRDSAASVLAGHAAALQATAWHHVALRMRALCKAAAPKREGGAWGLCCPGPETPRPHPADRREPSV